MNPNLGFKFELRIRSGIFEFRFGLEIVKRELDDDVHRIDLDWIELE